MSGTENPDLHPTSSTTNPAFPAQILPPASTVLSSNLQRFQKLLESSLPSAQQVQDHSFTYYESGVRSEEYCFKWAIQHLGLAFQAGFEPSAHLISRPNMVLQTKSLIGYPSTWQVSLLYEPDSRLLFLKVMPQMSQSESGSGEAEGRFYAALEVTGAKELTSFLQERTTQMVNIAEAISNEKKKLLVPRSSLNFGPTSSQFGSAYSPKPQPTFPLMVNLFRCSETFLKALEAQMGTVTLTVKFTLLDFYNKGALASANFPEKDKEENQKKPDNGSNNKNEGDKMETGSSFKVVATVSGGQRASDQVDFSEEPVEVLEIRNSDQSSAKKPRLQ